MLFRKITAKFTGGRVDRPYGWMDNPQFVILNEAKDLTYKRNYICMKFWAIRRRMTKAAGFSNLAAFISRSLQIKRKNPDACASGISGSRYKTNHLPHLLTTSNAVDGGKRCNPLSLCLYLNSGLLQSKHEFVNNLLTIRRFLWFFSLFFEYVAEKIDNTTILLDRKFTLLYNDKVSGKVKGRE